MKHRKIILVIALLLVLTIGLVLLARHPARRIVNEPFPVLAKRELVSGTFHRLAGNVAGDVAVYELTDGKRVMRFSHFRVSKAPELHVYLLAAPDAATKTTMTKAGLLDLGRLRRNEGAQNFDVPMEADLVRYQTVTLGSQRDHLTFATASLAPPMVRNGHGSHLER